MFFIVRDIETEVVYTLNTENVAWRKCRAHKKSRKILRVLRDIFFTRLFVFRLCATFIVRNFF